MVQTILGRRPEGRSDPGSSLVEQRRLLRVLAETAGSRYSGAGAFSQGGEHVVGSCLRGNVDVAAPRWRAFGRRTPSRCIRAGLLGVGFVDDATTSTSSNGIAEPSLSRTRSDREVRSCRGGSRASWKPRARSTRRGALNPPPGTAATRGASRPGRPASPGPGAQLSRRIGLAHHLAVGERSSRARVPARARGSARAARRSPVARSRAASSAKAASASSSSGSRRPRRLPRFPRPLRPWPSLRPNSLDLRPAFSSALAARRTAARARPECRRSSRSTSRSNSNVAQRSTSRPPPGFSPRASENTVVASAACEALRARALGRLPARGNEASPVALKRSTASKRPQHERGHFLATEAERVGQTGRCRSRPEPRRAWFGT